MEWAKRPARQLSLILLVGLAVLASAATIVRVSAGCFWWHSGAIFQPFGVTVAVSTIFLPWWRVP